MPSQTPRQSEVLTAKDIAEAIAFKRDPNGFSKALRQVKHWTDHGLLQTIGALDTGKGVAREYVEEPTIIIAGILQELTLFGLTIDDLRPIAKQLHQDADEGDPGNVFFAAETAGEAKGFLRLDFDVDTKGRLKPVGLKTFSLGFGADDEPLEENMPRTDSAIFLDLGKITSRIKWPGAAQFEAELKAMGKDRK